MAYDPSYFRELPTSIEKATDNGMRIAHIITRMIIGGAQENTLYNCLDLAEDYGDDVLLITGPEAGPEGELLQQGRAGGLRVTIVDSMQRQISPFPDWKTYRQLRTLLHDFRPDVVHTHSAKGGMLGRAAAWNANIPAIVHTVHGAPFHPFQPRLARWFFTACERWAAHRCHHLISVADAMTDLMVAAKVAPSQKFTTIYSGMEVEPFLTAHSHRETARAQLGIPSDAIVVGKIARFFHLKGHEDLIEAASIAVKSQPNLRFLLVGDGILHAKIVEQIERQGLTNHFLLTGLVPPAQIPYWISAMDMLVHTSLREGLARTLPQALLTGIPAISYDIDGAREVVRPEETGILLPPRDIAGLAKAINLLAVDASLRQRLGTNGQQLCRLRFDHRQMTKRIREIYSQLLANTQSPSGV